MKELGLPLSDHLLFLLDFNGDGAQADLLLDAFASLSSFLAEGEHAHRVLLWDPRDQRLQRREVTEPEDLLPLWQGILAAGSAAPLPALEEEELPAGISHGLYLCCQPQGQVLLALRDKYPSAQLTVLQAEPLPRRRPCPAGFNSWRWSREPFSKHSTVWSCKEVPPLPKPKKDFSPASALLDKPRILFSEPGTPSQCLFYGALLALGSAGALGCFFGAFQVPVEPLPALLTGAVCLAFSLFLFLNKRPSWVVSLAGITLR